ncbi:MAG TPA: hypothetical protein PKC67_15430 [Kiritimatiellia bacterium]|nr:hypothetical protein [Kiritimatiellia bacterium]HMP35727.1 hypothetical protein [Kiritimatiellia bacterium]
MMRTAWLLSLMAGWCLFPLLDVRAAAGVVAPSDTDPAITNFNNVHTWSVDTSGLGRRNTLFVMLPGTGGIPFVYQQVVRAASEFGFHAVGLMYPNALAVNEACAFSPDPDCHEKARREIITGADLSPLYAVDRVHSIEHRLIRLIQFLHNNHPSRGWGQYLDAQTNILWSKVIIAGHSQGGSHAAMIAHMYPVHRCLMFAAADWRIPGNLPATWVTLPGATPPERQLGLGHVEDPTVTAPVLRQFWSALGLATGGVEQLVDALPVPFEGSRMLMTALPSTNAHSCMITDLAMITNQQGSVYRRVWHWMMTGPAPLPVIRQATAGGITYEADPTAIYQLEYRAPDSDQFDPVGSAVSNTHGVVSAGPGGVPGWYRVLVRY